MGKILTAARELSSEPLALILAELVILPRCLKQYQRLTAIPWRDTADHLRAELQAPSTRITRWRGDYLRIHVPRRFTVRVQRRHDGMVAWDLYHPSLARGEQGALRKRGRSQRKAA